MSVPSIGSLSAGSAPNGPITSARVLTTVKLPPPGPLAPAVSLQLPGISVATTGPPAKSPVK